MNIINKNIKQKEKSFLRSKKDAFNKFFVLLTILLFVVNFFVLAKAVNANSNDFEVPMCLFEEKEGRTIVNFGDKKIVSHLSLEDAEVGPVVVDLPAGSYEVSLFSYDGYEGREGAFPQPKESWFATLKNENGLIAKSSSIDDLEDWILSATMTQIVDDELVIDEDIDSVSALNAGYPDESSPNSVFPICVAFDLLKLKEEPNHQPIISIVGSSTVNLIVGDSFSDPGATANDMEDGDITGDIVTGGDVVDANVVGTYIVTYNVADSKGLSADEVTRTVIVSESFGGGGGSSSSASSESSSSSSSENGVGGDRDGSISVGGGSGFVSFGGSSVIYSTASSASSSSAPSSPLPVGQCSFLRDYLKLGENNDPAEVLKLQGFLNLFEQSNISLTGVFDQATFNAVSDFQKKYKEDILTPWGYDAPTGYVYITTKNKINEIFCDSEITLSREQEVEIENVRNYINEFGRWGGSDDSAGPGDVGGIIGSADEEEGGIIADSAKESEGGSNNFVAASVGFIKSPMAFILDNKLTVALIGAATTLLIYLFSFKSGKI